MKRKTLSREKIKDAFVFLFEGKSVGEISIAELCRTAGVNRSTFYSYYSNPYEVFKDIAEDYLAKTALYAKQQVVAGGDFTLWLSSVLGYIKEHLAFSKIISRMNREEILYAVKNGIPDFKNYFSCALKKSKPELTDSQRSALANFIIYGTIGLISDWIEGDCAADTVLTARRIVGTISACL